MSNKSITISAPKLKSFTEGNTIDKTGYDTLKARALRKAVYLCSDNGFSVSGEECTSQKWDRNVDISPLSIPISKSPLGPKKDPDTFGKRVVDEIRSASQPSNSEFPNKFGNTTMRSEGNNSSRNLHSKESPHKSYILYTSNNQDVNKVLEKMEEMSFDKEVARLERIRAARCVKLLQYIETTTGGEIESNEIEYADIEEIVGCAEEEAEECDEGSLVKGISFIAEEQENIRQRLLEEEETIKRREEEEELKLRQKAHEELIQKEKEKKAHDRKMLYDNFLTKQKAFSAKYQEFTNLVKGCHNFREDFQKEFLQAKEANNEVIKLLDKCKVEELQSEDLVKLDHFCTVISSIVNTFSAEIVKSTVEPCKTEEESKDIEISLEEMKPEDEQSIPCKEGNSRKDLFQKQYHHLQENFDKVERSLTEFLNDDSLKKFRSDCRIAVNTPVNAISPLSGSHMTDKFNKLANLLRGQPVPVKDKRFSAGSHPLGYLYCSKLLAKKIVNQGEHVVSSQPEAAFPLASITIALWAEFPDFGDLLVAQFHKTCPYLVPIIWEQQPNETDEEYYKKLGFLYVNGEKEDLNMFLKRMGGVMRLYCAMIVTHMRKQSPLKHHLVGPWEGWRWCATLVNEEPRPEISATLLLDMLEVTGNTMLKNYRHQFQKLLHLICKTYIPKIDQVSKEGRKGPVSRLKNFLETVIYSNTIEPPNGLLPVNFW